MAQLEKESHGILGYAILGIGGDIGYQYSLLFCVCCVYCVVSSGQDTYVSDRWAGIHNLFVDDGLIGYYNLAFSNAVNNFILCCIVKESELSFS